MTDLQPKSLWVPVPRSRPMEGDSSCRIRSKRSRRPSLGADFESMPFSIKILLEAVVRGTATATIIKEDDIRSTRGVEARAIPASDEDPVRAGAGDSARFHRRTRGRRLGGDALDHEASRRRARLSSIRPCRSIW